MPGECESASQAIGNRNFGRIQDYLSPVRALKDKLEAAKARVIILVKLLVQI